MNLFTSLLSVEKKKDAQTIVSQMAKSLNKIVNAPQISLKYGR